MALRYSILGAGALGSVFGARLRLAGCAVELLNRSAAHSAAIRAGGLLAHLDGNSHYIDIAACTVAEASPADVIIIFTKTWQIDAALAQLPDTLKNTPVLTLQNGLGNGEQVARHVGEQYTLEGVSMMPAEFIRPGEVASSDVAHTWFYPFNGQPSALATTIGADFQQAGIQVSVTPDVRQFIWQKACFNIAMNALCALTTGSPGLLEQQADGKALAHELAAEALQVAAALNTGVDAEKVHALIDYACAQHTWHRPSMLQDLLTGRMTEIDALNGYLVTQADRLGLPAPLNHMLTRLIRIRQAAPRFWAGAPDAH